MRYDMIKVENLQYMENNHAESSADLSSPPPPIECCGQHQHPHSNEPAHGHSSPELMWPPHTQSFEMNDPTNTSEFNGDGRQQMDYSSEDGNAAVEDYSPAFSNRYQQASPANVGQMIRSIPSFDQGRDDPPSYSPQLSASSGSYEVIVHPRQRVYPQPGMTVIPVQSFQRISNNESYHHSPAPSDVEGQLHQFQVISQLTDQTDQVSSAIHIQRDRPSQSHISHTIPSEREASPSTVDDRGPSTSSRDYLSSVVVDSNITNLSLTHHQKDLLAEAVTRNIMPNLALSMSQRNQSPVIISSQSQLISSSPSHDVESIRSGVVSVQRSVSPDDALVPNASSHRYSPVQSSTPSSTQNFVSSSTGPMELSPTSNTVSSSAILDSTVDSTVETTESQLEATDEVVGSSSASATYVEHLDAGDGTVESTQVNLTMSDSIDSTDDIDTTVTRSTLNAPINTVAKMMQLQSMRLREEDFHLPSASSINNLTAVIRQQMDVVPTTRFRRYHKHLLDEEEEEQQQQERNDRIVCSNKECWCDDCNVVYDSECPQHRVKSICDKPVLSRAWASLPAAYLDINEVGVLENGESVYGVFAKKTILKRTKFGPVEGGITKVDNSLRDGLVLMIETEFGELMYLNTADEGMSNWMRFVRPAENYDEHNLVVIQADQSLYYISTSEIAPQTELKVWYSEQYAERRGLKMLLDEEELRVLENQDTAWPCFKCNQFFSSSIGLQKHLNEHEPDGTNPEEGGIESFPPKKRIRLRGKPLKKNSNCRLPKQLNNYEDSQFGTPSVLGESKSEFECGVCHKVFPRQYSLQRHTIMHSGEKRFKCPICDMKFSHVYNRNRHVRRHKTRNDSEQLARPNKSLLKKKRKKKDQLEGTEWVCTHCDLTFDNSSLKNLHMLTHAAENVGLDEQVSHSADQPECPVKNGLIDDGNPFSNDLVKEEVSSVTPTPLKCPRCTREFVTKRELIDHALTHGKIIPRRSFRGMINPAKPYKCELCYKSFATEERLLRHNLVHGSEDTKPLQCEICYKRFLNNSALACHIKIHSGDERKFYECPICKEGFDQIILLKDHVHIHCISGIYTCPSCQKGFEEYNQIRKHIRAFHSEKRYPCDQCDKVFPRPDKLKLHMLRHSDHREFLCANCGKQFKRKDKLKEHMKRMHSMERETRLATKPHRQPSSKKFIPKVSPTDYHRFIYKCHLCLLGFKRRGMLVNHLAKRHPDIRPDSVPELNLPILKTTRDYYCQYCEKVYKSSSKRKAHILKNHPGAELPMSNRRKGGIPEIPGLPNPTFSQTVGSVTTHPHNCDWCHKQYASKAKLLQHQRKKHLDIIPPLSRNHHHHQQRDLNEEYQVEADYMEPAVVNSTTRRRKVSIARPPSVYVERETSTPTIPPNTSVDSLQAADLLTQAMSELTSFTEYSPPTVDYHVSPRMSHSELSTLVNQSPSPTPISSIAHTMLENGGRVMVHYQGETNRGELSSGTQQSPSQSDGSATQENYIPRTWTTTFTNFPAR